MSSEVNHSQQVAAADHQIAYAEQRVLADYGDTVSVARKLKSISKFGRTEEVTTTSRTIALLGPGEIHETYIAANDIDAVVSTSAADTVEIVVQGHTIDADGFFTVVSQTVTLTGQTSAPLGTPMARVSRMYNNGTTDLAGIVYAYEDSSALVDGVPQTAAAVHCAIPAGKNQSFHAATTIAKDEYFFITEMYCSVNKKVGADIDVELEIRLQGKVFRQQLPLSVSTSGVNSFSQQFRPYLIVPKNADIRMTAVSLASSGIGVSGGFIGYLARLVP